MLHTFMLHTCPLMEQSNHFADDQIEGVGEKILSTICKGLLW